MDAENDKLTLSAADAAAADAVLEGTPGGDPARRARVESWLKVLDASPMPEPAGDLAARTLERVQADRMRLPVGPVGGETALAAAPRGRQALAAAPMWRRRMAEFGAMGVAAMLLLAVTFEGLGQARQSAKRTACATNLRLFTTAFGNYGIAAGGGDLPMLAMPANQNWLRGNAPAGGTAAMNNTANLLPLVAGKYLPAAALFCPGAGAGPSPAAVGTNEAPGAGYSYRDMYVSERPTWDGQRATIVLADKNPVFGDLVRTELEQRNSPNHNGKGSYVLCADGSAPWVTSPNVGPDNDNIWTIGAGRDRLAVYTGREMPVGTRDVFLCP